MYKEETDSALIYDVSRLDVDVALTPSGSRV